MKANTMGQTAGFKVRVGVVLIQNNQILLVRQNNHPFWILPGGTLEPGEDLKTCAIREMQEETNLTVTIDRLLYVSDFLRPHQQTVEVVFLTREATGTLQMTHDENLNDLAFYGYDAFKALAFKPQLQHQAIITDWANNFAHQDAYIGCYTV